MRALHRVRLLVSTAIDWACLGYVLTVMVVVLWNLVVGLLDLPRFPRFEGYVRESPALTATLALAVAALLAADRSPTRLHTVAFLGRVPIWGLVSGYFLLLAAVVLKKHALLRSHSCDLGIFENVLWNSLDGRLLWSSILNRPFFGEHFSPVLLALIPPYALWQSPKMLLVLQSAGIALGAVPIFCLARERLSTPIAVTLALAYYAYTPLYGAALFDFHPVALCVPLFGFAALTLRGGWVGTSLVLLGTAMACQEEICLMTFAVGVTLMFRRRLRLGLFVALVSALVFVLAVGVAVPWFRGQPFHFVDRYSHLGSSLGEIITTLVTRPLFVIESVFSASGVEYLLKVFLPLLFLPLLAPLELLPALPILGRLLISNDEVQRSLDFHFTSPAVPFLFFATIAGLERVLRFVAWAGQSVRSELSQEGPPAQKRTAEFAALLTALFGHEHRRFVLLWSPPVIVLIAAATVATARDPIWYLQEFHPRRDPAAFREVIQRVPANASVCADNRLGAHLARRKVVKVFPQVSSCEFAVLDLAWNGYDHPLNEEGRRRRVLEMLASGEFGLVAGTGGFVVLRRGVSSDPRLLAETLQTVVLDYPGFDEHTRTNRRDHVKSLATRFRGETVALSPSRFLPPGEYRAELTYQHGSTSTPGSRFRFIAHEVDGEVLGPWSLAEAWVQPGRSAGTAQVELTFATGRFAQVEFVVAAGPEARVDPLRVRLHPRAGLQSVVNALLNASPHNAGRRFPITLVP